MGDERLLDACVVPSPMRTASIPVSLHLHVPVCGAPFFAFSSSRVEPHRTHHHRRSLEVAVVLQKASWRSRTCTSVECMKYPPPSTPDDLTSPLPSPPLPSPPQTKGEAGRHPQKERLQGRTGSPPRRQRQRAPLAGNYSCGGPGWRGRGWGWIGTRLLCRRRDSVA